MKNLLKPQWLIVVNTIPVIILFIIAFVQYDIIESLLTNNSKNLWQNFALTLFLLSILTIAYATYCIVKRKDISIIYAIISMLCYTAFIYAYVLNNSAIMPLSIPFWMISPDVEFYPGTFLMPTLIHSLLIIIVSTIPKNKNGNPWLNLLYGLIFPILSYAFVQIVLPLWQFPESNYSLHVIIVIFIIITILFLFFICRGIYMLINSKSKSFKKYSIVWKIIIGVVFPLIGLAVNNGVIFGENSVIGPSPFGNFSNPAFYIIALVNGLLLSLPKLKNDIYRLVKFFGMAICLPYLLYFFLVFLPFIPISLIAIIVFGVGFLMLTPLILFIVQINEMYNEYQFLKHKYTTKQIIIGFTIGLAIIPTTITAQYLRDKFILNNALHYVYDGNLSTDKKVSIKSLDKTLKTIEAYKGHNRSSSSTGPVPFLTSYYNWLVLDNMILSDSKILTLRNVFFGEKNKLVVLKNDEINTVKIKAMNSHSNYDIKQGYWQSTLDISLQNSNEEAFGNYETNFTLPAGCWISDYYLYIGNKKEKGILAEKKSALWIFKQIKNENRDPGLLYYLTGNKIALKVFPFGKNELRKTGITFIHKEPVVLNIDNQKITLGNKVIKPPKIKTIGNITYIPADEKDKLNLVERNAEYNFIIDVSKNSKHLLTSFAKRVESYILKNGIEKSKVKIYFTNSHSSPIIYNKSWTDKLNSSVVEGGYFLDRAIKQILLKSYLEKNKSFPVIIAVTDKIENAVVLKDFADLQFAFPESNSFYELDTQNITWEHSLINNPLQRLKEINNIPKKVMVLAWENKKNSINYLPDNNLPSIIINTDFKQPTNSYNGKWETALQMQSIFLESLITPKEQDDAHLSIIKFSMLHQILSPFTSFIVVESEAQKKALKQKQDQILKGNKNLDTDEDTQSMSEPNFLLLIILVAAMYILKQRYFQRLKHN